MPHSVRADIPGGTFFFTVALLERRRRLLVDNIGTLREAFRAVRHRYPFTIEAIVILPDPLHCVWTLTPGDADFSTRWRLIKSAFARRITAGERLCARRQHTGERGLWQRRLREPVGARLCRAIIAQHRCAPTRVFGGGAQKSRTDLFSASFQEHAIRDAADLTRHVDYIHHNPVKHGHAAKVADWPYASFHRYVERGVYPPDWAAGPTVHGLSFE